MEALNKPSRRTLRKLFGDDDGTILEMFGTLLHSHIKKGVEVEVHLSALLRQSLVYEAFILRPAKAPPAQPLDPSPVVSIDVRGSEAWYWILESERVSGGRVKQLEVLVGYCRKLEESSSHIMESRQILDLKKDRPIDSSPPPGLHRRRVEGMTTAQACLHAQGQPVVEPISLDDHVAMLQPGRPLPDSHLPGPSSNIPFQFAYRMAPDVKLSKRLEQYDSRFDDIAWRIKGVNKKHDGGHRQVEEAEKEEGHVTRQLFSINARPPKSPPTPVQVEKKKEKKGFLSRIFSSKKDAQQLTVERTRHDSHDALDLGSPRPHLQLVPVIGAKRRSEDGEGSGDVPKRRRGHPRRNNEDTHGADANNDLRAAQDARDESMINVTDDPDMGARNAVAVLPVATTTVVAQAPTAIVTQAPTSIVTQAPTAIATQAPTAIVTLAPTAIVTQAPITTADAAVTARPSTRSVGVGTAQAPGARGPAQAPGAPGPAQANGARGPAQAPGAVVVPAHNAAVVSEDVQLPSKDDIRRTIKQLPETAFTEHLKAVREKCEAEVLSKKMSAVALTSSKKRDIVAIIKTHALLAYHPMTTEEYNAIAYEINKMIDRLTRLVELGQRLNRCMKRKIDAAGRRKVAFGGRMEQRYDEFKAYSDRMGRAMARLTTTLNQY